MEVTEDNQEQGQAVAVTLLREFVGWRKLPKKKITPRATLVPTWWWEAAGAHVPQAESGDIPSLAQRLIRPAQPVLFLGKSISMVHRGQWETKNELQTLSSCLPPP